MRTRHPKLQILCATALLAALSALPSQAQQGTSGKAGAKGTASTASAFDAGDRRMLADLTQANLAEIETGKLAVGKAQSAEVKKFAQQMIDDHTSALKDVQQLGQSKGVELPKEPGLKHKTVATALKALRGETFDKQYMSQVGVGDHRSTQELLQKVQAEAKDADLKALASKMLPVVQGHLAHAERMTPK